MVDDRQNTLNRLLAACVLLIAAALLLARSRFGAGMWGDEPYGLSTALRYYLGDRPLVDSWDTNFSSAILALPFVGMYMRTVGSTGGIILAFRGVFIALTALTSTMAVAVLRRVLPFWLAVTMGVLLMLYIPFLSTFVGYGADLLWHMLAAFVAVELLVRPRRGIVNALPGALCALGIIGNPPTVVIVPLFACALWLSHRESEGGRPRSAVGWYLAGGGIVGVLFLLELALLSGPQMLTSIRQVANPDDHSFGAASQLTRLWQGRWLFVIPAAFGCAFGVVRRFAGERSGYWTTPAVLACCGSAALWAIGTERIILLIAPQSFVFIVGAGLLIMGLVSGTSRIAGWQTLLVLPATGAGIGWFLGSNAGVGTGVLAAPLILAASLAWWPQATDGGAGRMGLLFVRWSSSVLLSAVVLVTAAFGMLNAPDGPTTAMTEQITRGPFKGIRTTPEDARLQEELVMAITGLPPVSGRVVFMERFPLGYLIAGKLPGSYSTWVTSAKSQRLGEYADRTGNRPARVVLTRFSAETDDAGFPRSVNLTGFPGDFAEVYSDENLKAFDAVKR